MKLTSAVGILIILNVIVYVAQLRLGPGLEANFALWPLGHFRYDLNTIVGFKPWQLITSGFLHDTKSLAHIGLNMFALWSFGTPVERALGERRFMWLYVASLLSAGLAQLVVVTMAVDRLGPIPTVGASGGVFGVLLAFAMLFPRQKVMLVFPPIPMPAWLLVTGYAILELTQGVLGTQQGVAHFAHLGGMVGGFLVLAWYRRQAARPNFPV